MSHESELTELIQEYGEAQFKAGQLYATIQHHVTMLAVLKEQMPVEPEEFNTGEPLSGPTLASSHGAIVMPPYLPRPGSASDHLIRTLALHGGSMPREKLDEEMQKTFPHMADKVSQLIFHLRNRQVLEPHEVGSSRKDKHVTLSPAYLKSAAS